jgi:hypothetical protein
MVLLHSIRPPSLRGLPARCIERADGAFTPPQRATFVPIEPSEAVHGTNEKKIKQSCVQGARSPVMNIHFLTCKIVLNVPTWENT